LNFQRQKLIKFHHLSHLKSKNFQITFIKSYSSSFPTIPKVHPSSLINFCFDLNEFLMKKLFNIQSLLPCRWKHYETNSVHHDSLRAFHRYQEHGQRCHGLGDVNMTKKTKKSLPSFVDRYTNVTYVGDHILKY
jgi:hypothetical protein